MFSTNVISNLFILRNFKNLLASSKKSDFFYMLLMSINFPAYAIVNSQLVELRRRLQK